MRVIVIGGLGNFGARICRRLRLEPGIEAVATSRRAVEGAVSLDIHATDFESKLKALRPDVVIHCAGPYQGQDYRVAIAALGCGAHYIDLADGREFVARFAEHNNADAIRADRVAITGASTLPALSSAVVDFLQPRFAHLHEIDMAIAPGQHAPRGTATIASVLGYAGRGFKWLQNGSWRTAYGWQELRRMRFPFGTRYAAACDVPDLELFPQRYPDVHTVAFRAALEVPLQHYGLWGIAALRRIGLPLPVDRWAGMLNSAGRWLDRFGSDCGGMSVSVRGTDEWGHKKTATWYLVAQSNHGPEIPCMAAVLLTLKLAANEALPRGAHACMGMLKFSDFEPEFARWNIKASIEEGTV